MKKVGLFLLGGASLFSATIEIIGTAEARQGGLFSGEIICDAERGCFSNFPRSACAEGDPFCEQISSCADGDLFCTEEVIFFDDMGGSGKSRDNTVGSSDEPWENTGIQQDEEEVILTPQKREPDLRFHPIPPESLLPSTPSEPPLEQEAPDCNPQPLSDNPVQPEVSPAEPALDEQPLSEPPVVPQPPIQSPVARPPEPEYPPQIDLTAEGKGDDLESLLDEASQNQPQASHKPKPPKKSVLSRVTNLVRGGRKPKISPQPAEQAQARREEISLEIMTLLQHEETERKEAALKDREERIQVLTEEAKLNLRTQIEGLKKQDIALKEKVNRANALKAQLAALEPQDFTNSTQEELRATRTYLDALRQPKATDTRGALLQAIEGGATLKKPATSPDQPQDEEPIDPQASITNELNAHFKSPGTAKPKTHGFRKGVHEKLIAAQRNLQEKFARTPKTPEGKLDAEIQRLEALKNDPKHLEKVADQERLKAQLEATIQHQQGELSGLNTGEDQNRAAELIRRLGELEAARAAEAPPPTATATAAPVAPPPPPPPPPPLSLAVVPPPPPPPPSPSATSASTVRKATADKPVTEAAPTEGQPQVSPELVGSLDAAQVGHLPELMSDLQTAVAARRNRDNPLPATTSSSEETPAEIIARMFVATLSSEIKDNFKKLSVAQRTEQLNNFLEAQTETLRAQGLQPFLEVPQAPEAPLEVIPEESPTEPKPSWGKRVVRGVKKGVRKVFHKNPTPTSENRERSGEELAAKLAARLSNTDGIDQVDSSLPEVTPILEENSTPVLIETSDQADADVTQSVIHNPDGTTEPLMDPTTVDSGISLETSDGSENSSNDTSLDSPTDGDKPLENLTGADSFEALQAELSELTASLDEMLSTMNSTEAAQNNNDGVDTVTSDVASAFSDPSSTPDALHTTSSDSELGSDSSNIFSAAEPQQSTPASSAEISTTSSEAQFTATPEPTPGTEAVPVPAPAVIPVAT